MSELSDALLRAIVREEYAAIRREETEEKAREWAAYIQTDEYKAEEARRVKTTKDMLALHKLLGIGEFSKEST